MLSFFALLFLTLALHAEFKPEVPGPDGERAFRDLGAMYLKYEDQPPASAALADLTNPSPAKRAAAGRYLLALFVQSFADQTNGRVDEIRKPAGLSTNLAGPNEYRSTLASHFGEEARGAEALETVSWIFEHELDPEPLAAAIKVLPRIESPGVAPLLAKLLGEPHPNGAVLACAVAEAGRRKLTALAPKVQNLRAHYREPVRKAAQQAAPRLSLGKKIPDPGPPKLTPDWPTQLATIRELAQTPVPDHAPWFEFVLTTPDPEHPDKPTVDRHFAWLLEETPKTWIVLTINGVRLELPTERTKRTPGKFDAFAQDLVKLSRTPAGRKKIDAMDSRFPSTETKAVSTPACMAAAWCAERGDQATAAALLRFALGQIDDDRHLVSGLRYQAGTTAHLAMLDAFCFDRDYPKTLMLARHLSRPVFADYAYHDRAKAFVEQLPKRMDDFKTLVLPSAEQWADLQSRTPRAGQIQYLLARLRLLNCFQFGQPGEVDFSAPQFVEPGWDLEAPGRHPLINPLITLEKMNLTVRELPLLAPALADDNYVLANGFWRNFVPQRELYPVNEFVASLINRVAQRDLAQLDAFTAKDAAGKAAHLAAIVQWCESHAEMTRDELILETLKIAKTYRDLISAANSALQHNIAGTGSILLERMADFPAERSELAAYIYASKTRVALEDARTWLNDADPETRFGGAMVLVRDGKRAEQEGLAELRAILEKDDAQRFYPRALDLLLAHNDEASLALACGILRAKDFGRGSEDYTLIEPLVATGRQEVLDFLLAKLDDLTVCFGIEGPGRKKRDSRKIVVADYCAGAIVKWRGDDTPYDDRTLPDAERAPKRAALKPWLLDYFTRLRARQTTGSN